jgi:hypothetical protein
MGFPMKMLYAFLMCPMFVICPIQVKIFGLIQCIKLQTLPQNNWEMYSFGLEYMQSEY